ncbi:MAG: tetratricopeptide repeat protein [Spirochaetales bacterium]|nr:tetratricopeptide repeat protein [Spirochaetales bacterium]
MKRYLSLLLPILAVVLAFAIVQSGNREDIYRGSSGTINAEIDRLFVLFDRTKEPSAARYSLIHLIVDRLDAEKAIDKVNFFLTTYVAQNPQDPFDADYLYRVAENYRHENAVPLAIPYYERIVKDYPDVFERGDSVHYRSLDALTRLVDQPSLKRKFYEDIAEQFPYKLTKPEQFYEWGHAYEQLGLWKQAIKTYSKFLLFPDPVVPGDPQAYSRVKSLVDLSKSDLSWVYPDLHTLIAALERAIESDDTDKMEQLRAKVGFFALSWDDTNPNDALPEVFDIRTFLRELVQQAHYGGGSVWFSPKLDDASNNSEAYLKSTGWTFRIPTWYFCFKRISYPADPEVNGAWEWAGVFFGDKM